MSSRPRSPPAAAPPLDDDDLLSEILLRLPPQPSSLPRASAVSKRWRSLVTDARFVRRFRTHHRRSPPLLGFFDCVEFMPTMDPPNRVPEGRISLRPRLEDDDIPFITLGCHHGLVLFIHPGYDEALVWDPVSRSKHRLAVPPLFEKSMSMTGAVLRAAGDIQHFQVVLVGTQRSEQQPTRAVALVYSSETGVWGDLISRTLPPKPSVEDHITIVDACRPSVQVGNSLYFLLYDSPLLSDTPPGILEFDLDSQRLDVIPVPVDIYAERVCQFSVMRADDGGLGFLFISESDFVAQLWKWNNNCDGAAPWVLGRTVELDKLLSLNSDKERAPLKIVGFAEYNNMVVLRTAIGLFTVHLESLQFKKIFSSWVFDHYHLFESVYTAGMGIDDGNDGAELLHNT